MKVNRNIWNLWNVEYMISGKILQILTQGQELDRINYLKCKLGIESFVINISKLLIIYFFALNLGVVKSTFLLHLSFILIRTFAYGKHAKTASGCVIVSTLLFVGIPFVLQTIIRFSKVSLLIFGILSLLLLYLYAPGVTEKNKLRNLERKKQLRRKALISCLILICLGLSSPLVIANLVIMGNLLAAICVLPKYNKKNSLEET